MKFSYAIMNPPYHRNLHLKFLEKVIKVTGKTVNISPVRWLQDPFGERPKFMNGHIESFEFVPRAMANAAFAINEGDLSIDCFCENGKSFTNNPLDDEFCCFKYTEKYNDWRVAKSIFQKLMQKNILYSLRDATVKNGFTFPLKYFTTRYATSGHNDNGGNNGFRIVSKNYSTAIEVSDAAGIKYLNFGSEKERKNAYDSFNTTFARFCIAITESLKMSPYMGDYTKPWTNARFCEYFGITGFISDTEAEPGSEWETILETMKKYA